MNKAVKILAVTLVFFSLAVGSLIAPFGDTAQAASAFQARVTVSKAKVYTGPGKKYRSIGTLYRNTSVTVKGSKGSWYKISFKGKTRYIYNKNAKKIVRAKFTSYKAYVKSYSLKIRNKASSKYKTIRTVYMNTKITVIGQKNGYAYIYSGGKRGYVQKKWLKSKISSYKAYVTASTLNMRKGPGTKYKHVKYLHKRYKVTVSGYSGGWYRVKYGNKTGFVKAQYIKKGTPPVASVAPAPHPAPAPTPQPTAPVPQPAASDNKTQDQNQSQNQNQNQTTQPAPASVTPLSYKPVSPYTSYVGQYSIKVYSAPSNDSNVTATLYDRTAVQVIGMSQDENWLKIDLNNGKDNFVQKENLDSDWNHFIPPVGAKYGVDFSYLKGNVNFQSVQGANNSFVILKASEGTTFEDPNFSTYIQQARDAGLQVNAYHFFRARTVETARAEADYYVSLLNKAHITDSNSFGHTFLDVEAKSNNTVLFDGITREQMAENINAFLDEMRVKGFTKLGIYANKDFYENKIDYSKIDRSNTLLWLARYRSDETSQGVGTTNYSVDIWQYSSAGRVSGINGYADLNVVYTDKF
ncbi:SH3 domain-containing protein [Sporolactobacillus sp. STCC-11]|uniref:SH3 domain-containing protein n=1 Tax=Sporolactobacillus caesalpiniae TaxID=3230362 RepID=UPI00339632DD